MARPRTDIKPRIVAAARTLFFATGVDGTSLRAVAREADTSVGMIYYYFPTKDELFLEVVEEVYSGFLADIERALARDAPVTERLHRVVSRAGAVSELELQTIKLVIREMLGSSDRRDRLLERFRRGHLPLLLQTVNDGVAEGSLRSDLPAPLMMVATFTTGVIPQLMRRALGDNAPVAGLPEGDALADLLLEALLSGVSAPGSR